jgi:hypothetical protein
MMPMEDTEAGLGFYMFSKTKENAAITAGSGYAGPAAGNKKELGNELDLWVNKSYGNDMKIGGRVGMFMPGTAIKDSNPGSDKTHTDFLVQASMGF